jgi:Berberine and berberine like
MHRLGPTVVAGAVLYPFEQTRPILARFRDSANNAPAALTVYPCLIRLHDQTPVLCMAACYAGPVAEGVQAVVDLGRMGDALDNQLGPMSYVAWQSSLDAARPAGRKCGIRSHFLAELADGFVEALVEHFAKSPSQYSVAIVEHCHGAIGAVAPDATAFALRRNPYHFEILAFWDDAERTADNLEWADRFLAATSPFSTGEVYVNSLDEGEAHRIREAYGPNFERLRRIERKYDRTNFFQCNQNIPPSED